MYHGISDGHQADVHPYYKTNTNPTAFAEHMQFLAKEGYRTVTLSDAVERLRAGETRDSRRNKGEGRMEKHVASPSPLIPLPQARGQDSYQPSSDNHQLVVITFDDGFRDFYTHAFPVLQKHNFTATMFLPTAFIRETEDGRQETGARLDNAECRMQNAEWKEQASAAAPLFALPSAGPFQGKEFLTWSEVRELHAAGIEFGSHTVTHPKLVDLSWDQIEFELYNSKSAIESHLSSGSPRIGLGDGPGVRAPTIQRSNNPGIQAESRGSPRPNGLGEGAGVRGSTIQQSNYPKIHSFCYPYAFPQADTQFADRFGELLHHAGYTSCATTQIGRVRPGADPFRLKRLPVNDCDDLALFRAKLEGSYDWLSIPQVLAKRLKSALPSRSKQPKQLMITDHRLLVTDH